VIVITALGLQDGFPSDWDSEIARSVRLAASEISASLGWREASAGAAMDVSRFPA
jgi:hypothetical protein